MDLVDPAMRAVLERLAAQRAGLPERYGLPFPEARAQLLVEREPWLADGPHCPCETTSTEVDGRTLRMRVYRPATIAGARRLVYLHGGGWCVGSPATHDNIVRRLAVGLGCEAWSIDYALAPEAPYPAGLIDAVAAIRAAKRDCPDGALVVAGDSAGANLALDAARALRGDRHVSIDRLLLFYGVYTDATDDASMGAFGDGRWGLSRAAHERYLAAYRGNTAPPGGRPITFALDDDVELRGMPPVYATVAALDILHDQQHALVAKLHRQGVAVTLHEVPGVVHGFLSYGQALPQAGAALKAACAWVLSAPINKVL